jgi:tRNA (cytidine32/uridine32-2'-O)-methyltransferase
MTEPVCERALDEDIATRLRAVRIVLVDTSHPGNIGAAARAMKTMCLDRLVLVRPAQHPSAEASARASGAADVLHRAQVCRDLPEALEGCGFVVGASARQRSLPWPLLAPRACGERVAAEAADGEVALLFGNEQSGLANDELKHCHALVQIPTNPDYGSLNLAMAVQVLCYEIMVAAGGEGRLPTQREAPLARAEDMDRFFSHLERALAQSGFLNPANPRHLMQRLRRLFNRAELDENELNILRGILTALAPGSGRPAAETDGAPANTESRLST